ncbi:MAG: hypothetical protein CW338_01225 [Clostridiales bacterium]|nr:hypothetical protein [Clostridiales bacterium]
MPLYIVGDDITRMKCDAIVNPTDCCFSGSGGADADIHAAAGQSAAGMWKTLPPLSAGECVMTDAGELPCRKVIHTVGPVWKDGKHGERETIAACYSGALRLAKEAKLESVAMPLIGAGTFGCPEAEVYSAARNVIRRFLETDDMTVYLLVYNKSALNMVMRESPELVRYVERFLWNEESFGSERRYPWRRMSGLASRIPDRRKRPEPENWSPGTDRDARLNKSCVPAPREDVSACEAPHPLWDEADYSADYSIEAPCLSAMRSSGASDWDEREELKKLLEQLDAGFTDTLIQLLCKKNISNTECYRRANIDRKLFSKICSDRNYHPSKKTVLALAVALELNRKDTEMLLKKAGYALSGSSLSDQIVGFFIDHKEYDIFHINEALFSFDQEILGNVPRDI